MAEMVDALRWIAFSLCVLKFALRLPGAVAAMRGDTSAWAARSLGACGLMVAVASVPAVFAPYPAVILVPTWRLVINLATLDAALVLLIGAYVWEARERWHRLGTLDLWGRLYCRAVGRTP